jgi:hypothetical protein
MHSYNFHAQFLTLCSASTLAEKRCIASPFRANHVQRGEPFRGRLVLVHTRFYLLQTARH